MNERLKSLFAALVIYRHNINILHWKVKGCHFDCLHELFDNYGDKFNSFIDEVAEILLITGCNPLSIQACIENASNDKNNHIVLSPDDDYDCDDAPKQIGIMFSTLLNMYAEISNNKDLTSDLQSKLDEHMHWLRLEYNYKNSRRVH